MVIEKILKFSKTVNKQTFVEELEVARCIPIKHTERFRKFSTIEGCPKSITFYNIKADANDKKRKRVPVLQKANQHPNFKEKCRV